MARGVFALVETQEEAERQVRDGAPQMRILRSRRISLAGLPPLPASGPLENPWVVVVEHTDPAEEAKLPQDEDPEGEVERSTRELYLNLATDPEALVTGVREASTARRVARGSRFPYPLMASSEAASSEAPA
jgi:hypothetical protein